MPMHCRRSHRFHCRRRFRSRRTPPTTVSTAMPPPIISRCSSPSRLYHMTHFIDELTLQACLQQTSNLSFWSHLCLKNVQPIVVVPWTSPPFTPSQASSWASSQSSSRSSPTNAVDRSSRASSRASSRSSSRSSPTNAVDRSSRASSWASSRPSTRIPPPYHATSWCTSV